VCKDSKGTTSAYKSKIRTLFVNLKDKNNPGLRRSVTAGDIPAQTFARMTSQVRSSLQAFWECGQHVRVNQPVLYRTWPLRNARRLTRKLRKTTYSYLSAQPTSRQKQTRSNAAGANRY
jgi:hypothetical protein